MYKHKGCVSVEDSEMTSHSRFKRYVTGKIYLYDNEPLRERGHKTYTNEHGPPEGDLSAPDNASDRDKR